MLKSLSKADLSQETRTFCLTLALSSRSPPPPSVSTVSLRRGAMTSLPPSGSGSPSLARAAAFGHPSLRKWGGPTRAGHAFFLSLVSPPANIPPPPPTKHVGGNLQRTSRLQFPSAPSEALRSGRDEEAPLGGHTDHLFVSFTDKLVADTRPFAATPVCDVCVCVCLGACPVRTTRRQR